jgi:hypothetical protein
MMIVDFEAQHRQPQHTRPVRLYWSANGASSLTHGVNVSTSRILDKNTGHSARAYV